MHPLVMFVYLTILGSPVLAAPRTLHPDIADQNITQSVPAINVTVMGTAGLVTSIVLAIVLLVLRIVWRARVGDASSHRPASRRPSRSYRRDFEGTVAALDGLPVPPTDPMVVSGYGEYHASSAASDSSDFDEAAPASASTGLDAAVSDDGAVAV